MVSNRSLRGQAKAGALVASMAALMLSVVFLSGPSLGEDKSLLNTQTGDKLGLDSPKELDARFGGSGAPSQKSENEEIKGYVRGQADSRARNYVLRLISDNLQDAGRARWGQNFSLQSSFNWQKGSPIRGSVSAVIPLVENQANWGSFLQPGFRQWTDDLQQNRNDVSLGYVARRRIENLGTVGGSVFLDRSTDYGHQRASLGAEWRGGPTFLSATLHQPLTGPRRGPDGRYERVLGGWNAKLRRSIGDRLSVNLSASEWRDPGDLDGGKTIGGISLGESQSVGLSFQAHPAVRLYGDYARSRTPSSKASDSWKLGFEYRLTGERQRLRQASKEGEGGIFDPIRERPALSVGIVALAALILTDESGGGGGGGAGSCPQNPSACPKVDGVVQIVDTDGNDVGVGAVTRPVGDPNVVAPTLITVRATLPSVPSNSAYKVNFVSNPEQGTAILGKDYILHSLWVTQGGTRTKMTNPTDHFRVAAGGEAVLEAVLAIKAVNTAATPTPESASASEIVMQMVPVALSQIGTGASLVVLETDPSTGVITARIRLAPTSNAELGERAVGFSFEGTSRTQRGGTLSISTFADASLHGVGDATATHPDSEYIQASVTLWAILYDLGSDNKVGGAADTIENFPENIGPIKAYVRLALSGGATTDSYTFEYSGDGGSVSLVPGETNLYEVNLKRDSGFFDASVTAFKTVYNATLDINATNPRFNTPEQVVLEVEDAPVSLGTVEDPEPVGTYVDASKNTVTVRMYPYTADTETYQKSALFTFGTAPGVQTEPTHDGDAETPLADEATDLNIPISVAFSDDDVTTEQEFSVALKVRDLPSGRAVATRGEDFEFESVQTFTKAAGSADNGGDPDTATGNLVIQILPDDKTEAEEYFELEFDVLEGNTDYPVVRGEGKVRITIARNAGLAEDGTADTLPPVITGFSLTSSVGEPATGTATITVRVETEDLGTGSSTLDVPVRIGAAYDTTTAGDDYVAITDAKVEVQSDIARSVTEDTADDFGTLDITINADALAEGNETLTVTVLPTPQDKTEDQYEVPEDILTTATARIIDADVPFFRLSVPNGLRENRDDPSLNVLRISAHTGNGAAIDDATKQLALERPLTFFIDGTNSANNFDNNDRVTPESLPESATIPAGQYYVDFPVQIENNELVDGPKKILQLKRIVADSKGALPGLLEKKNHRGLGSTGVNKGVNEVVISDDDRVKLQLWERIEDEDGNFSYGQQLNSDDIEVRLAEAKTTADGTTQGVVSFFLTVDKNFHGVGSGANAAEKNSNRGRVRIDVSELGTDNNNNAIFTVLKADGSPLDTPLSTTADRTDLLAQIPITDARVRELNREANRLVLELRSPSDENLGDASKPINIAVRFHENANDEVFDTDAVDEDGFAISQDVNYISNDLSIAIRDKDSLVEGTRTGEYIVTQKASLHEGESTPITAILVRGGEQVDGSENESTTPIKFIVFWEDANKGDGVAKAARDAADYDALVAALDVNSDSALTDADQPDYPTDVAHYGFVTGAIPVGASEHSVQLPVLGDKTLDGRSSVTVKLVAENSSFLVPTGRQDEKEHLNTTNAEKVKLFWKGAVNDGVVSLEGTEGTLLDVRLLARLVGPDGTVYDGAGSRPDASPDLGAVGAEFVQSTITPVHGDGDNPSAQISDFKREAAYFANDDSGEYEIIPAPSDILPNLNGLLYDDDFITRDEVKSKFSFVLDDVGPNFIVDKTPLITSWANDAADKTEVEVSYENADTEIVEAEQKDGTPAKRKGTLTFNLGLAGSKKLGEPFYFRLETTAIPAGTGLEPLEAIIPEASQPFINFNGGLLTFAKETGAANDSLQVSTGLTSNEKDGEATSVNLSVKLCEDASDTVCAEIYSGVIDPFAGDPVITPFRLIDADQNRVVLTFVDTADSWTDGSATVAVANNTQLYEDLAQKGERKVRAKLVRPLVAKDTTGNGGDIRLVVTLPDLEGGGSSILEVANTAGGTANGACQAYATTINLDFVVGSGVGKDEIYFCVKTTETTDTTADGFQVSPIQAKAVTAGRVDASTPTPLPATDFTDRETFAKFIVMDDANFISIATGGITVTEGATPTLTTSSDGVAVTAPTGKRYKLGLTVADGTDYPIATAGEDYKYADLATTSATGGKLAAKDFSTLGPNVNIASLLEVPNDEHINGARHFYLTSIAASAGRGVKGKPVGTGASDQTTVKVTINDDDAAGKIAPSLTANTYPTGRVVALNGGSALSEGAEQNFHIVLDTAHRANAINSGGTAPLIIKLSPSSVPSGFTGADYTVAESTSATTGVSIDYDPSGAGGKGEVTIAVKRQNNGASASDVSVKSIPMEMTLTEDQVTEGGGTVEWQITHLGDLGCDTLVEPATANSDTGCYRVGSGQWCALHPSRHAGRRNRRLARHRRHRQGSVCHNP